MTSPDLSQRSDSATASARDRGARDPLPLVVDLPPLRPADVVRVAAALAASDERAGGHPVTAVILREAPVGSRDAVDPSVAAGVLAHAGVGIVVEASTSRHAPYNLARRVQSLARLTGGRAALLLRADGVDPVTLAGASRDEDGSDTPSSGSGSAAAPSPTALLDHRAAGVEYLTVLRALWASFPEDALVGDAASGVLADTARLVPPRFSGEVYAVEGVLNVPLDPRETALVIAEQPSADAGILALVDAVLDIPSGPEDPAAPDGLDGLDGHEARLWAPLHSDVQHSDIIRHDGVLHDGPLDSVRLADALATLPAGADAAVLRVSAGSDPAAALSDPALADAVRTGLITPRATHGTLDDLTNTRKAVAA